MNDTTTIIDQYNAAFLERAPEKLTDLIAADCVMQGTGPAPDGNVWTGYEECLAGWQGLASDPTIKFEVEHVDVDGDRAVIRWRITGAENYRGVNLMRMREGKIVEALGYGKRPQQQFRAAARTQNDVLQGTTVASLRRGPIGRRARRDHPEPRAPHRRWGLRSPSSSRTSDG